VKEPTQFYGTVNATLLFRVLVGVVTVTFPVLAPGGTLALISVFDTTLYVAVAPLKATSVVPVRLFPRIITVAFARPEAGKVLTKGGRPVSNL
jgi:hypothetical protein